MRRKTLIALLVGGLVGSAVGAGSFALGTQRSLGQVGVEVPTSIGIDPLSQAAASPRFPKKGGIDAFESLAEVAIVNDVNCGTGVGAPQVVRLAGPTVVQRGPAKGKRVDKIQTEIISMNLTGFHENLGPIVVRESAAQASSGLVKQIGKDRKKKPDKSDFPATSFFDVFVEIELPNVAPGQVLMNQQPVHMRNDMILKLPPIGNEYRNPFGERTQLFFANGTPAPFCVIHAVHVPEDPSHIILFNELQAIKAAHP